MPISPASAIASISTVSVAVGPTTSSSRCTLPAVKKSIAPLVIPIDIRSVTVAPPTSKPADPLDRPLQLPRRPGRARLVTRAVEEEQQRVAAPLEQAGSPVVGLVEQCPEHAVEGVAHQLGADLSAACQTLGERGEARDVDEREGSLNLSIRDLG